jgi:hypothetical protein
MRWRVITGRPEDISFIHWPTQYQRLTTQCPAAAWPGCRCPPALRATPLRSSPQPAAARQAQPAQQPEAVQQRATDYKGSCSIDGNIKQRLSQQQQQVTHAAWPAASSTQQHHRTSKSMSCRHAETQTSSCTCLSVVLVLVTIRNTHLQ